MMDPERVVSPPPLFQRSSPLSAAKAPTAENSDAPRVSSGACSFMRSDGRPGPVIEPAATTIIVAKPAHKKMVFELQRKFSNQLGFLPSKALDFYIESKNTGIAIENGEPCGYVLGRPAFRYNPLLRPITQAAVFMDAQRRHHGLALVEAICRRAHAANQLAVQASCAIDIEAIDFWLAAGFMPIGQHELDNRRKRNILVLRRCLTHAVPVWFHTMPLHHGHKGRKDKTHNPEE